jgi:hypothetical protein
MVLASGHSNNCYGGISESIMSISFGLAISNHRSTTVHLLDVFMALVVDIVVSWVDSV